MKNLKRFGFAAFMFFLIKGLLWLAVPAVAYVLATSRESPVTFPSDDPSPAPAPAPAPALGGGAGSAPSKDPAHAPH